jgi:hypothetical protein
MKTCIKCKRLLDFSGFHRRANGSRDGYVNICKECKHKYDELRYKNDRDKILENSRIWYINHKEEKNRKNREWNTKNEEKRRQMSRKYYLDHKEEINKKAIIWGKLHIEEKRNGYKKYRKTNKGKLSMRKCASKRRKMLRWVELFITPFPKEIEIDYHHVNGVLTIPIPRITHVYCSSGQNKELHKKKCNEWIKKLYGLDIDKLLSE